MPSQLELLQPQSMDPAFMHQTSQPPLPPPQCDAATQASASTNVPPSADAGQQVATAVSLQGSPVEEPLPVAPKAHHAGQGKGLCRPSQTKPSAAPGEHQPLAGPAMDSTGQQTLPVPVMTTGSAVPQQSPSAAQVAATPQQHPVHTNTINIRLELGAAAQPCCDCQQQRAPSEPHANRKRRQYPTQLPSTGVLQMLPSTPPAVAGLPELQSTRLVQHTSHSSHSSSSDHHVADGTGEQPTWPPIWTLLQDGQVSP